MHELEAQQRRIGTYAGRAGPRLREPGRAHKFSLERRATRRSSRSLLYAERLVNLDKKGPFSLRHRAYAQALAGLHWGALEDLKAALTQSSDEKPAADLTDTPWEPLIDKMCRYDFAALQQQPPPAELRELGALVAYKVVENSTCENQTLVTGRDVLAITPESYLVCDSMCRYSGVSNRHMTTVHGPVTMRETLAKRLQGMPSLPDATAKVLQAQAGQQFDRNLDPAWAAGPDRIALIESLVDSGEVAKDQLEPSWQALGRLIEDVTFVHIYRRLEFFQNGLGLPRTLTSTNSGWPLRPWPSTRCCRSSNVACWNLAVTRRKSKRNVRTCK